MEANKFERLAVEHYPALYSYCLAKTCDIHRAEELAQETLYRAFVSFDRLRNQEAFRGWLLGIAKRCSWNWFRKIKTDPLHQRANEPGTNPPESISANGCPSERLAVKERISAVLKVLKKVSKRNREVVILRYFEELSYGEIAQRLGISVDAVDQRLTRARLQLRVHLEALEI